MNREPNPRLVMMMGREMPFLPKDPPNWFSRRILEHYPSAAVLRFGPIPREFAESLTNAYKTDMDKVADLLCLRPSQIPLIGSEELDENVSIFFVAMTDDVSDVEYMTASKAMAYATKRWYEEFPDEEELMTAWLTRKFQEHGETV